MGELNWWEIVPKHGHGDPICHKIYLYSPGVFKMAVGNECPAPGTSPMPMPNQKRRRLWMPHLGTLATGKGFEELVRVSIREGLLLLEDRDPTRAYATRPLNPDVYRLFQREMVIAINGLNAFAPKWKPSRVARFAAWNAFVDAFQGLDQA